MQEIDSFKQIFKFVPEESTSEIKLTEDSANAKIHHLNIKSNGVNLVSFSEQHSDQVGQLFLRTSNCTKNADGIILFEDSRGKNMLLCEMKSSGCGVFDTAFQQAFSSYMKICMLLSLCDNFNISNYKICFIFTSQDGVDLVQKQNELEQIDESQRTIVDKVRLELLRGGQVRLKLSDIPHNISFFHRNFTNKEVICQLLTSSTDTITFDVRYIP